MTYFVTGATGFIGRHLVERLLEREGDIHVLVREASQDKLERWAGERPGQAGARRPERAAPRPGRRGAGRAEGQGRPLLPPGGDLRHGGRRGAQRRAQRRRHAERRSTWPTSSRWAASTTCPRSPWPGSTTRARSTRTCSTRARSSPTRTTARSSSPRSSCASACSARGASTGRRSSSATRAPARWTRSTAPTTSSRASRSSGTTLPEWFPLVSVEWGWTNIVPVDYVAAAVDHIAHLDGLDGQAFHIVDPKGQRVGRRDEHLRQRRARAARGDADRPPGDAEPAQGRAVVRHEAARAEGHPGAVPGRPGDPRGDPRLHGADLPLRRARHQAGAARHGHRGAAAGVLRRRSCGTTGSARSTRTCTRTARSRARSTARRWSSPARPAASAARRR